MNFISVYNQKLQKLEFPKWIRVRIENQVCELQKKSEKLTSETLIWVKNGKLIYFSKTTCLRHMKFFFLVELVQPENAQRRVNQSVQSYT